MFALMLVLGCGQPQPEVRSSGVIQCSTPSQRDEVGPLQLLDLDDDWGKQPDGGPPHHDGWGVVVVDFNDDGIEDIYLPTFGQDLLYQGLGEGRFTDVTDRLPQGNTESLAASAADVDGDGDLDIAVARRGHNVMLMNDQFEFTEREMANGGLTESYDTAWGDLNGDGYLELFVSSFYFLDGADVPDRNELYLNNNGSLTHVPDALPELGWNTPANAGSWTDIDDDGDLDLYIANDKSHTGYFAVLLENQNGVFVADNGSRGLARYIDGMGVGAGDINDDTIPDFLMTGWDDLAMMVSAGDGTWYDTAKASGMLTDPERLVGWGAELVDVDNDGDLDGVVAYGPDYSHDGSIGRGELNTPLQRMGLYINDNGSFTEASAEWGIDSPSVHRGFVMTDLNRDGLLDLILKRQHEKSQIFMSTCNTNAWLQVSLEGPAPNTRAIGARVYVEADGRSWQRDIHAGSSNVSSGGPPEAHFGLGNISVIDQLRVRWPDGSVHTVEKIDPRQRLILRHPEANW